MTRKTTRSHSGACVHEPQTRLTADYRDGWLSIKTADPTGNFTGQLLVAFADDRRALKIVAAIEGATQEGES